MRKTAIGAVMALLMTTVVPAAQSGREISTGERVSPLWGWVQFCSDNPAECNVESVTPQKILLTDSVMMDIRKVNMDVNLKIKYVTDKIRWGDGDPRYTRRSESGQMSYDKWSYEEEFGDCEDYVLVKRRALLARGYPRSALLITIVETKMAPELHAVLTVVTDKGDFVLDNIGHLVLPWWETRYTFLSRQSPEHPSIWLKLVAQPKVVENK